MKTYTVAYERDEDRLWVASIEALPGCHTQGRTIEQARRRIREALAAYLDDDKAAARARLVDDVS
jgi:predicted RNase H-like HicB family nuclease